MNWVNAPGIELLMDKFTQAIYSEGEADLSATVAKYERLGRRCD